MNPLMRVLGMILRLVGISSPEDIQAKAKSADGLPSWRKPDKPENPPSQERRE
jgi:hypothetical protein